MPICYLTACKLGAAQEAAHNHFPADPMPNGTNPPLSNMKPHVPPKAKLSPPVRI